MNPTEQTDTEFAILARERHDLTLLLLASGARGVHRVDVAIDAYAVAKARAAVAVVRQVQAEREDNCPACGKASIHAPSMDRHLHQDGTDNRNCWLRIVRGEGKG